MRATKNKPLVSIGHGGQVAVVRVPIVGKTPGGQQRSRVLIGVSEDGFAFIAPTCGWTPETEAIANKALNAINDCWHGATRPATAADRAVFRRMNRDNLDIWRMQKRLGLGHLYPKPKPVMCPKVFKIKREYQFEK